MRRLPFKSSAIVYSLTVLFLAVIVISCRAFIRDSLPALFVGGLLNSMIFFFILISVSHIRYSRGVMKKPGMKAIIISQIVAQAISLIIHPIVCITCFCFSIPSFIYLGWSANMLNIDVFVTKKHN